MRHYLSLLYLLVLFHGLLVDWVLLHLLFLLLVICLLHFELEFLAASCLVIFLFLLHLFLRHLLLLLFLFLLFLLVSFRILRGSCHHHHDLWLHQNVLDPVLVHHELVIVDPIEELYRLRVQCQQLVDGLHVEAALLNLYLQVMDVLIKVGRELLGLYTHRVGTPATAGSVRAA